MCHIAASGGAGLFGESWRRVCYVPHARRFTVAILVPCTLYKYICSFSRVAEGESGNPPNGGQWKRLAAIDQSVGLSFRFTVDIDNLR